MFNLFKSTQEDDDDQQDRRPVTRSRSREAPGHLNVPNSSIASFNGVARGQQLGRRTPSPRPIGHNANSAVIFQYDSTNVSQQLLGAQSQHSDAEEREDLQHSATPTSKMSTSEQSIEQLRASAAAAVEAANAATAALVAAAGVISQQQAQHTAQPIRTRKPELPEFDSKNVEIWIRRVQSAYDRAAIVLPKDKFAFLETKFAVGANPAIDAYLYGPATEEAWTSFLAYLREEYGRTVRQEAQYLRGQFSRDGRKPTQMLAHMKEKVKRVTVDDILKEIIISSLPPSVQQMILERVKDMTADEAASVADRYFNQDGRPLHSSSSSSSIQHVDAPQVESTHAGDRDDYNDSADAAEINAIRGQRAGARNNNNNNNNKRPFKPFNNNGGNYNKGNNKPRSNFTPAFSHPSSNTSSAPNAAASSSKAPIICMSHQQYGDKSYTCQQGCSHWPEFQRRQAGKGNAGKRQ